MAITYRINALADNQCQLDAVGTDYTPYPVTRKMDGDFYCIQTSYGPWMWNGAAWRTGVSYTATADDGMVFAGWYTCANDYETTGNRPQNVDECNVLVTSSPTLSFDAHDDALRHWYPHPNHDIVHKIAVAKWYKPGDPTVTFNANAEYSYVEPEHARTAVRRCRLGDQIVLAGASRYPQNEWMFSGWYTLDGTRVGGAGEYYVPTADITLYAHWHTISQHDMDIRLTPAWVTSATWSYEDYGEDIRAASGNDPGAIGKLRWRIVLPAEPKTYFESIHFGIWGDDGYIGSYPGGTLPWGGCRSVRPASAPGAEWGIRGALPMGVPHRHPTADRYDGCGRLDLPAVASSALLRRQIVCAIGAQQRRQSDIRPQGLHARRGRCADMTQSPCTVDAVVDVCER